MDTRTVIKVSDVTYIQRQDFPFLIKIKYWCILVIHFEFNLFWKCVDYRSQILETEIFIKVGNFFKCVGTLLVTLFNVYLSKIKILMI